MKRIYLFRHKCDSMKTLYNSNQISTLFIVEGRHIRKRYEKGTKSDSNKIAAKIPPIDNSIFQFLTRSNRKSIREKYSAIEHIVLSIKV